MEETLLEPDNYTIIKTNSWTSEGPEERILTTKTASNISLAIKGLQEAMKFKNHAWTEAILAEGAAEIDDNDNHGNDDDDDIFLSQDSTVDDDDDDDNDGNKSMESKEKEDDNHNHNKKRSSKRKRRKRRKNINFILNKRKNPQDLAHFFGSSCGTDAGS